MRAFLIRSAASLLLVMTLPAQVIAQTAPLPPAPPAEATAPHPLPPVVNPPQPPPLPSAAKGVAKVVAEATVKFESQAASKITPTPTTPPPVAAKVPAAAPPAAPFAKIAPAPVKAPAPAPKEAAIQSQPAAQPPASAKPVIDLPVLKAPVKAPVPNAVAALDDPGKDRPPVIMKKYGPFQLADPGPASKVAAPIPAAAPGEASDIVGVIVQIEGKAMIRGAAADAGAIPAAANTPVRLHDILATMEDSRALVMLVDNTQITLGGGAGLSVEEYIFDPDSPLRNKAHYNLSGNFKYASGAIAQIARPDVKLTTPFAEIGIRGTTLWGGQVEDQYGIFVIDGAISVSTGRGRITVGHGQGTLLAEANAVPARASAWPPAQITASLQSVAIKDGQGAAAKIALLRGNQRAMIGRYKAWMIAHPETATRTGTRIENPNTAPRAAPAAKTKDTMEEPVGEHSAMPKASTPSRLNSAL